MIDTTMICVFVQGNEDDRKTRVEFIRRALGQHVDGGYEADFQGIPSVHAQDEHGHWNNFDIKERGRRDLRKLGPKPADHPSIGHPCPVCDTAFQAGDYTILEMTHAADPDEARKAQAGRAFTAVAVEVHWDCRSQTR